MKGHLDVKDLEKYKKADIEKLAADLGVSAEGTVKEIAARCAAVEVELPDEEVKKAEEEAAAKAKAEEEAAAKAKAEEEAAAKANAPSKAGKVVAIQTYDDKQLKRIVEAGEELEVDEDRANLLMSLNLVKLAEK